MKIYKVTLEGNELHFIAEDKDHVITLLSSLIGTTDYFSLMNNADIQQVAGPVEYDEISFYAGL